jgi:transposase
MSKKKEKRVFTEEFKRESVRITETSDRTVAQVAEDLGIGLSTLTRWKRRFRETKLLAGPHSDVNVELQRLRRENELLRQERDLLKKAAAFFAKETSR